jgi:serine/threonine-protein kinase
MQRAVIEVGTILGGKLRVIRQIGYGGMGAVYEVEHTLTKHRRALKLLHKEMSDIPAIVTRFLREASAAGHIGNPHVVETFDAGQLDTGEPYIVMELLEGKTLGELLEQTRVLGLLETCEILIQACDGVSAAHASGIVHRDLKPENLFLLKGPRPFIKILDFGISKFDPALTGAQGITMDGSTLGTPFYMPPEQVRGDKSIDAQADIYSLGVILYECLAGARPFEADTLPHLAVLIAEGRYIPPRVKRPELPADVDAVVARAMASDRTQRYRSVDEFRAALAALRSAGAHTGPASMNFGATLVAGSPGSSPPPAGSLSTPPTAAVPWPASPAGASPTPAADAGPVAVADPKAPAYTASQFSRTTGGDGSSPRSRVALLAALALAVGAAVGALLLLRKPAEPPPETSLPASSELSAAAPPTAPLPRAMVLPRSVEPAAPSAAASSAVPLVTPAPAASNSAVAPRKQEPSQRGSSRAKAHGVSEENPF